MRQGHEPLSGAQCPIKGVGGGGWERFMSSAQSSIMGTAGKLKRVMSHSPVHSVRSWGWLGETRGIFEPRSSAQCPITGAVGGMRQGYESRSSVHSVRSRTRRRGEWAVISRGPVHSVRSRRGGGNERGSWDHYPCRGKEQDDLTVTTRILYDVHLTSLFTM